MSDLLINLTSDQICETIVESYLRLSGGFSATIYPSSNAACGYMIYDGECCPGIFVGNSSFDFYQNLLNFDKASQDLVINLNQNKFYLSGADRRIFSFNEFGNINITSGCASNKNGIFYSNLNPAFQLLDESEVIGNEIVFYNSGCNEVFKIKQSGDLHLNIDAAQLSLKSLNENSLNISGNFASFNSPLNTGYNFYVSGNNSYIGNCLDVSNSINVGNSICILDTGVDNVGLCVKNNANIDLNACVGLNLIVGDSVNSNSICSSILYSSNSELKNSLICNLTTIDLNVLNSFCSNFDSYLKQVYFTDASGSGIISSSICSNSICANNLNLSGNICLFSTGIFSTSGNYFNFYGNDVDSYFNLNLKNLNISGNVNSSGEINSIALCSLTGRFNSIKSELLEFCSGNVSGSILSPCVLAPICSSGGCYIMNSIFQNSSSAICFQSELSQFGPEEQQVSITSGSVFSKNTAKSWGIFELCSGVVQAFSGFNFTGISNPLYLLNCSGAITNSVYGLKFINPIKSPFSINFNITFQDCYNPSGINYYPNNTVHPEDVLLPEFVLLNCASTTNNPANYLNYEPISMNNCYYEILFNALNAFSYSINGFNGCVSFSVFGS